MWAARAARGAWTRSRGASPRHKALPSSWCASVPPSALPLAAVSPWRSLKTARLRRPRRRLGAWQPVAEAAAGGSPDSARWTEARSASSQDLQQRCRRKRAPPLPRRNSPESPGEGLPRPPSGRTVMVILGRRSSGTTRLCGPGSRAASSKRTRTSSRGAGSRYPPWRSPRMEGHAWFGRTSPQSVRRSTGLPRTWRLFCERRGASATWRWPATCRTLRPSSSASSPEHSEPSGRTLATSWPSTALGTSAAGSVAARARPSPGTTTATCSAAHRRA
mmetsp:Transcript_13686/g.39948  ORF Transcript_13686/g.39948 Transcript_13686/m.39948 type:complete len:276 (-) Transcript_13686:48-875(-)